MLKTTLHHFEVLFRAKDRNADLIRLVKDVIHECRRLDFRRSLESGLCSSPRETAGRVTR